MQQPAFREFIAITRNKRILSGIFLFLFLLISIPITVLLTQKSQDIRQHAFNETVSQQKKYSFLSQYNAEDIITFGKQNPTVLNSTNTIPVAKLSLTLPGIGKNPDPHIGLNTNPLTKKRNITYIYYDQNLVKISEYEEEAEFDPLTATYISTVRIPEYLKSTEHYVEYKLQNTTPDLVSLNTLFPPPQSSQSPHLATIHLKAVSGDTDNDSSLTLLDYNQFLNCFKNRNCDSNMKLLSDLNDDGAIDLRDFNILFSAYYSNSSDFGNTFSDLFNMIVTKKSHIIAKEYYQKKKNYPWITKEQNCNTSELLPNPLVGITLSFIDAQGCILPIKNVVPFTDEEYGFMKEFSENIYATQQSVSKITLCFAPKTTTLKIRPEVKYSQNAQINPLCPSTSHSCYYCTE